MAYNVTRGFVQERLALSKWQTYSLIKASYLAFVSTDDVIRLLNESRRGCEKELNYIPADIITAEQAEKEIGIPATRLLRWTHNTKKIPPHFHFNNKTIRFRRESLKEWIDRRIKNG